MILFNTFCVMQVLNEVCLLPLCSFQLNFVMYCCSWGTCVPISHYGYHIFRVAEHAKVGLRTKTVCLSCLCSSCFLTASNHLQAVTYIILFLGICGVGGGKTD